MNLNFFVLKNSSRNLLTRYHNGKIAQHEMLNLFYGVWNSMVFLLYKTQEIDTLAWLRREWEFFSPGALDISKTINTWHSE